MLDVLPHLHSCAPKLPNGPVNVDSGSCTRHQSVSKFSVEEIHSRFQNAPSSCLTNISRHHRWCRNENNFKIMLVNLCKCVFCDFLLIYPPQLILDHLWCGSDQCRNAEPSRPAAPAAVKQETMLPKLNILNTTRSGRREGKNKRDYYKHRLCLAWDQWKVLN